MSVGRTMAQLWLLPLYLRCTIAAPISASDNIHSARLVPRYVASWIQGKILQIPGPVASTYPTDDQARAAFDIETCHSGRPFVFYTETPQSEGARLAERFARSIDGVYIEDCFPNYYVCSGENTKSEPSWCPNFLDRASGIYADHAGSIIYLVTASMEGVQRSNTTWSRVEAPTLMDRGHSSIIYVNSGDFQSMRVMPTMAPISGLPTVLHDASDLKREAA